MKWDCLDLRPAYGSTDAEAPDVHPLGPTNMNPPTLSVGACKQYCSLTMCASHSETAPVTQVSHERVTQVSHVPVAQVSHEPHTQVSHYPIP